MLKEEVLALVQQARDARLAAVDAEFSPIMAAISSIEVNPSDPSLQAKVDELSAQVADLQVQLQAEKDKFVADEAQDQIDMDALKAKLEKDESALAQVKAICDALLAPQA
jgi:hypothetical protein